jgi:hypothetical protein
MLAPSKPIVPEPYFYHASRGLAPLVNNNQRLSCPRRAAVLKQLATRFVHECMNKFAINLLTGLLLIMGLPFLTAQRASAKLF